MGFKQVKQQVLDCLQQGRILHEQRHQIDVKNLLATDEISVEEVMTLIGRAQGNDYSTSPHHVLKQIPVHILKTKKQDQHWYIKWYFIEPNTIFISVHQ